jgi:hypothetical protein
VPALLCAREAGISKNSHRLYFHGTFSSFYSKLTKTGLWYQKVDAALIPNNVETLGLCDV